MSAHANEPPDEAAALKPRKHRTLSRKQAQRCEDGDAKRCRCRCRGRFHGAKRGDVGLRPAGDPHHVPHMCERCASDNPPHRRRACLRDPITGRLFCRRCFDHAQRSLQLDHYAGGPNV